MKTTPWMNSVLLAAALCSGSALAADADTKMKEPAISEAATLQKNSDPAAAMGDKDGCPVHAGAMGSVHKDGEPCPYMKTMGKEHEGCDVRDKKNCLDSHGEPCQARHDMQHMSALHEACDPAKGTVKGAK